MLKNWGSRDNRKGAHCSKQHNRLNANKDKKTSDHRSLFAVNTYATVTDVVHHSATRSHSSPSPMASPSFVRAIINVCMIRGISCVVGLVLLRRNDYERVSREQRRRRLRQTYRKVQ